MDAAQQTIQRLAAAMREELAKAGGLTMNEYLDNVISNLERNSDELQ